MTDADNEFALRLVLSPAGKPHAEEIAARLRAIGFRDVVISPRAVNLRGSRDLFRDHFGVTPTASDTPPPPGLAEFRKLGLDDYVKFAYFPTRPEFFGP